MGARGPVTEYPVKMPLSLSEAQRYRLEVIAIERGDSLAGAVRYLIDNYGKATQVEKHEGFIEATANGKAYVFANPGLYPDTNHALRVLKNRDHTRALWRGNGLSILGAGNTTVNGTDVSTWEGFEIPS